MGTLNIRSIQNPNKASIMKEWLIKQKLDIVLLQETHLHDDNLKHLKDWPYDIHISAGKSNSCGVATLISKNLNYTINWDKHDDKGRILALNAKINNEDIIIINCYFPTKDKQKDQTLTLKKLESIVSEFSSESFVIGGDFNVVMDTKFDKKGGTDPALESKDIRLNINTFLETFNLVDIMRIQNPHKLLFTWHAKKSRIYSRLDYFFVSDHLLNRAGECVKKATILTDHHLVRFPITSKSSRGRGYWKFNSSLLKDLEYVNKVKNIIQSTCQQFQALEDKALLWDLVKMNVRGFTIKYSAKKKKERESEEKALNDRLSHLINKEPSDENTNEIDNVKNQLELLYKHKAHGALIRSRMKIVEEGEKNTKFFLKMENNNSQNKTIMQIQKSENEKSLITDGNDILQELKLFYTDLYSQPEIQNTFIKSAEKTFLNITTPLLSENEQSSCEGIINYNELLTALKQTHNNKTPGTDGFTNEFYKFFWIDISNILLNSFNYSFQIGQLSIDQRRGLISLLPKKDKNKLLIKNWRPVALLNCDYKLISKTLANRLKTVIAILISEDQTGYIKDRYIGENIRTIIDIDFYLKKISLNAFVLQIDFQKAFDTINWSFIDKTLAKFNFGPDFKNWVKLLYCNSECAILNNGHFTEFFKLERGVRQGCPLSAFLFILVAELLSLKIKQDENINGIKLQNGSLKVSQLADDTNIYIGKMDEINPVLKILDAFAICSGLKTNIEKTKIFQIGNTKYVQKKYLCGLTLEKENMHLLGLTITHDYRVHYEFNIKPKLSKMNNLLKLWSCRNLSLKGKIIVLNTIIIPIFIYPATIMGIDDKTLLEIDKTLFDFIWSKRKPKIAKPVIQQQYEKGGLKAPNILNRVKSWQIMWLQRATKHPHRKWVIILDSILGKIKFKDLLNSSSVTNRIIDKLPCFYKRIINEWQKLSKDETLSVKSIKSQMLWLNKHITINKEPFLWTKWYDKGILSVSDLTKANSIFLSHSELNEKYELNCSFLECLQIRQSIPLAWRQMLRNPVQNVEPMTNFNIFSLSSKSVYWTLMEKTHKCKPSCIDKWMAEFNVDPENDIPTLDKVWEHIFILPFKSCEESILQSFQFRVLHRILPCNHWLNTLKITPSPICTFCDNDDTIIHYLAHCHTVINFWNEFVQWWESFAEEIDFDENAVIFGFIIRNNETILLNYCIILAKFHIYNSKRNECTPNFQKYLLYLKDRLELKRLFFVQNGMLQKFNAKWSLVCNNV